MLVDSVDLVVLSASGLLLQFETALRPIEVVNFY